MTRFRPLLLLALAGAAMFLSSASQADAARNMELAVQDEHVLTRPFGNRLLIGRDERTVGLQLTSGLHAGWIRANVLWADTLRAVKSQKREPAWYTYDWSLYDGLIDSAAARGLKVQVVLTGPAPAWATGNQRVGTYKPKTAYYLKFVQAAVEHFRGRVSRYSIWNEPNYNDWLTPRRAAAGLYRDYYTRGYALIKQLDPSAQVLFGELAANGSSKGIAPLKFIRDVTCANGRYRPAGRCPGLRTDGVAMHPYDLWHKPNYQYPGKDNVTLGTMWRLTTALDKLQRAGLFTTPTGGSADVYVTEYGYLSASRHKVTPRTQGRYLVQAMNMAVRNPRIKQMLQYLLVKTPGKWTFFDTSIATRNGTPTAAYRMLAGWAAGAIARGDLQKP